MSKQERLAAAEAEILNPTHFLFDNLRTELLKDTITEKEAIITTIDVLRNETFQTYSQKKMKIDDKFIKKLKILSILTHFYECQQYNLTKLSLFLSVSKQDCLNLLLEASINKLISVKIDEQNNKILIVSSKIRQRQSNASTERLCNGKLLQIIQKNNRVDNKIRSLLEIVDPSPTQQQQKKPGYLAKYLQSLY